MRFGDNRCDRCRRPIYDNRYVYLSPSERQVCYGCLEGAELIMLPDEPEEKGSIAGICADCGKFIYRRKGYPGEYCAHECIEKELK